MMDKIVDVTSLGLSLVCAGVTPEGIEKWIAVIISALNLIAFLVFKIMSWRKKAKEDGKITADEVAELAQEVHDAIESSPLNADNDDKEDEK